MNTLRTPGFTGEASLYRTTEHYRVAGISNDLIGSRGALPQLANDTWTTDKVCVACGCSVSGFVCNCGLRPDPAKLACIQNGGPSKVMLPVRTGVGIKSGTLTGFRA